MKPSKPLAVILAAGASRRMGTPKALLKLDGQTFLSKCVDAFARAKVESLVVLGADAEQIEAAHPHLKSVRNPDWPNGQLSSALTGLRAALAQGADLIFVHPVDAPRLLSSTVSMMISAALGHRAAVPAQGTHFGHPLALSLLGARMVLAMEAPTLWDAVLHLQPKRVSVRDPGAFENINQPEQYQRLLEVKR
jgi:molybdenum cofactor cytidylyltransferase